MPKNGTHKLHIAIEGLMILKDWSGVEHSVAQISQEIIKRGHDVSIIAEPSAGKLSKEIITFNIPKECNIIPVEFDSKEALDKSRQTLIDANFDVVLCMDAGQYTLGVPWMIANRGIPMIICETCSPTSLSNERSNPYEHFGMLAIADKIQVLLESSFDYYPKSLQDKITVIGRPAPLPKKIDYEKRANKKNRILLALGRLEEATKNYSTLIRAWAILAPQYPDWSLKLVGSGPSKNFYDALVMALPNARIELIKAVTDTDAQYETADIFCLPSKNEGLGLTFLEAAAWGLPMVGLEECIAARDIIEPGMGVLAKESTPSSLADAIRKLMDTTDSERNEMGKNAQLRIEERFNANLIFDKLESLFFETAKNKGVFVLGDKDYQEKIAMLLQLRNEGFITDADIAAQAQTLLPAPASGGVSSLPPKDMKALAAADEYFDE